jgi:type IV pilus assembly protein PilN
MIKINLAPPAERKGFALAVPSFNLGWLFAILYAVMIIIVGGWWWMLSSQVNDLTQQIDRNTREHERLKVLIAEGQRFKKDKEELERRVSAIEAVARMQTRPVYLLDAVVDSVPKDVWLTRVEEKQQALRLAGATFSSTALADFMANLKASGKFKDVDLVESRQDLNKSPRTITFEVSCRFEI